MCLQILIPSFEFCVFCYLSFIGGRVHLAPSLMFVFIIYKEPTFAAFLSCATKVIIFL